MVQKGAIKLQYVSTDEQVADVLNKPMSRVKFEHSRDKFGVFHNKTKHIEIRYFYIRDMVHKGAINIQYVRTYEQVAYVLKNPLSHVKFEYFRYKVGVVHKDFPQNGK